MPIPFEEAVKALTVPFYQIANERLFLSFDRSGTIIDIWGQPYVRIEAIVQFVKRQKNIFDIFSKPADLDGLDDRNRRLFLRESVDYFESAGEFYTNAPILYLNIYKINSGRFLGLVSRLDLLPIIHYSHSMLSFFIDPQGRLRGFNRNFAEVFALTGEPAEKLLNRPITELISPDPFELQQQYLKGIKNADSGPLQAVLDERALESIDTVFFTPANITRALEGIEWNNSSPDSDFITFGHELDLVSQDFEFTLEVRDPCTHPLIIAGNFKRTADDPFPDQNGYLAGMGVYRTSFMIKKQGYVLINTDAAQTRNATVMRFIKKGRSFHLYMDDALVLQYFDPEFLGNRRVRFSLALHPESRTHIRSLSLKAGPAVDFGTAEPVVVQRRISGGPTYLLNRLQTRALSASFPYLWGYHLSDVTPLRKETERFKQRYQREKKRGDQLKQLIEGEDGLVFIGISAAQQRIREQARIAALTDASILLQGETGTGKDVLARFIHTTSPRKDKPFIKVDCSAIPQELIESELFGHEAGAFTGATGLGIGRFEAAEGGTLFLDEIGNLDLRVQAKLLNVLQDFTITRVGGTQPRRLDLRLISASNADLRRLIKKERFREDLFFRINTVTLTLVPLAQRTEDIPDLCAAFVGQFNRTLRKKIKGLSPRAYQKLYAHPWPGNVRELRNLIHKAIIFCEGEWIEPEMIQPESETSGPEPETPLRIIKRFDASAVREIAERHRGCIRRIARELGVTRQTCYTKLKELKIDFKAFR